MERAKTIILLFMIIAVLVSCSKNPSDPEILTGTIAGRITDRTSGNPLSGAQVTTTPTTMSRVTDMAGDYVIEGIEPGQYTVRASKDNYADNTVIVSIDAKQTVTADIQLSQLTPELFITPDFLDFGTATGHMPLTIQNSTGTGTLSWTAAANQNWITLSVSSGSINTNLQQVIVSVDRSGLTPGNYYGNISFNSNGGTKDITITIAVVNPDAPQITLNLQHLDFDSVTSSRELSITNTGTGSLNWSAVDDQNWLSTYPDRGSINSGSSAAILVNVDRAGQSNALYSGTVTLNSNGGNASVSVVMKVTAGGALPAPSLQPPLEVTNNTVTLAWTRTMSEEFGFYRLYYASHPGVTESDNMATEIQSPNHNQHEVTGLLSGTQYYFKVYVYNSHGLATPSNEISAITTTPLGNWVSVVQMDHQIEDIAVLSDDNVYVTTEYNLYNFDGSDWSIVNLPENANSGMSRIDYENANNIWITTNYYYYHDEFARYNGVQWETIESPFVGLSSDYPVPVSVISQDNVWVCYSGYLKYRSNETWQNVSIDAEPPILSIEMISDESGWLSDDHGKVFKYNGFGWSFESDFTEGNGEVIVNGTKEGFLSLLAKECKDDRDSLFYLKNEEWIPLPPPFRTFSDSDDITAIGGNSETNIWCHVRHSSAPEDGSRYQFYKWNGDTWSRTQSPVSSSVQKIVIKSITSGWAIAGSSVLRYAN